MCVCVFVKQTFNKYFILDFLSIIVMLVNHNHHNIELIESSTLKTYTKYIYIYILNFNIYVPSMWQ